MADTKLPVGMTETKDALKFAFALVEGIQNAEADGKFNMSDLPGFMPALLDLPAAVAGAEKIPLEFKGMDVNEATELKQWVKDTYSIPDDKLEQTIENAFAIIIDIWIFLKDNNIVATTPPDVAPAA